MINKAIGYFGAPLPLVVSLTVKASFFDWQARSGFLSLSIHSYNVELLPYPKFVYSTSLYFFVTYTSIIAKYIIN